MAKTFISMLVELEESPYNLHGLTEDCYKSLHSFMGESGNVCDFTIGCFNHSETGTGFGFVHLGLFSSDLDAEKCIKYIEDSDHDSRFSYRVMTLIEAKSEYEYQGFGEYNG